MTDAAPSKLLKSLYVARFVLELAGVLLVLGAIFAMLMSDEGHGGRPGGKIYLVTIMLACALGFLLPQVMAKLLASLIFLGAGVRMFCTDAYRSSNLEIYVLFFIPLAAALWLYKGYRDLNVRRLSDAHQLHQ